MKVFRLLVITLVCAAALVAAEGEPAAKENLADVAEPHDAEKVVETPPEAAGAELTEEGEPKPEQGEVHPEAEQGEGEPEAEHGEGEHEAEQGEGEPEAEHGGEHVELEPEHGDESGDHAEEEGSGEVHHPHWSYVGPHGAAHWNEVNALCSPDSPRQSPIDIVPVKGAYDESLSEIDIISKTDGGHDTMTVVNNGHSVNVQVHSDILLSGGKLGDVYKVAGFHFHWGSEDSQGSEHIEDGKRFPLEMHVVTYDSERYAAIMDAVFGDNSLAVLGTLFEISPENNTKFDVLIDALQNVINPGEEYDIPALELTDLLPPTRNLYYRYYGSLTTPPCAESVVWTVYTERQKISHYQMEQFRRLAMTDDKGEATAMVDNWRPVQPLHTRTVSRSFRVPSETGSLREEYIKKPKEQASQYSAATAPASLLHFGLTAALSFVACLLL